MTDKDEYIKVLDFLEHGRSGGRDEPLVQGIGTENFNLLEVVVRENKRPKGGQELYIGEGDREVVKYIKDRIGYEELSATAKNELEYVLQAMVSDREDEFVEFFNTATPVTPRRHAFQLLPGIGKKHMQRLLDEREKEEFDSFEDINERVDGLPEIDEVVVERIEQELKGDTNHKLLTS